MELFYGELRKSGKYSRFFLVPDFLSSLFTRFLDLFPFHFGAEGAEVFDEAWVGAFDRVGVLHHAAARDAGRNHVERDGGTDHVGRVDDGGTQRLVAKNDDTMWIVNEHMRAELRQLGHPGKAVFVNLVPKMDRAGGTRAERDHEWQQIDREIRPRRGLNLRQKVRGIGLLDHERLVAAHDGSIPLVLDDDAQLFEGARDQIEVMRQRVFDPHFTARDRPKCEESDDLVVVGVDRGGSAVQAFHSLDPQHARADAFDFRAHRDEHGAQVLHVGFARGVDQGRNAFGKRGAHEEIFRDGNGHVVAPMAIPMKTIRQVDDEWFARLYAGTELGKDFQVWINLAHAEGTAGGIGADGNFANATEQRGIKQHRRAHVLRQLVIGERVSKTRVIEPHFTRRLVPVDVRTLRGHERHDFTDIGYLGNVFKQHRPVGQQRGADDGERGVFVAGRDDRAGERLAAVDNEVSHVRRGAIILVMRLNYEETKNRKENQIR